MEQLKKQGIDEAQHSWYLFQGLYQTENSFKQRFMVGLPTILFGSITHVSGQIAE
jgi:diacylglycerol kinase